MVGKRDSKGRFSMMVTRKPFQAGWASVLLTLTMWGAPAAAAEYVVTVDDPWVREGPPTARVNAGYMVIRNPSDQTKSIVSAGSPAFRSVEIHRTVTEQGVARMVKQERLQIPARGQIALEPGSYHLMLLRAQQPLREGDTVEIVLYLEGGRQILVNAPVRKANDTGHAHHHHH